MNVKKYFPRASCFLMITIKHIGICVLKFTEHVPTSVIPQSNARKERLTPFLRGGNSLPHSHSDHHSRVLVPTQPSGLEAPTIHTGWTVHTDVDLL